MNRGLFYLSFVCVLLGAAGILAGSLLRVRKGRRRHYSGVAEARVVDLLLKEDGNADGPFSNRYYPVLQFYAGGKLHEIIYPEGAYPARWEKGQIIPLEYDPENPARYALRTTGWKDRLPGLLYGAGVALVLLGCVLFIRFSLR